MQTEMADLIKNYGWKFCGLHGYLVQCYLDCRTAIHKDCPVLHWKYEGWSYGFITKDSKTNMGI